MKNDDFVATIGIETHVQFNTKTKIFAAVDNDSKEAEPNTLVSHICFGLPGSLPVLNEQVIKHAIKAAAALGTRPQHYSQFDRKHYFYPDLPKGYQITQLNHPIITDGRVDILVNGQAKTIGITRAHLEEDAGKNTHPNGKDYSLVDLNRAGTPLLEIVSEPDIHTAAEAKAYAKELYLNMKYAGITEANLYYGNMRFDVNVSVSKDPNKLGTRSETKNLNSFRSVEKAVEFEIARQIELLNKGQSIVQETRGWDDAKQKTFSQRSKEEAHDYRYFPDPDLPPVVIDDAYINEALKNMPLLPREWRDRLAKHGLDSEQVEILLEANVDYETEHYLDLLLKFDNDNAKLRTIVNYLINIDIPLVRDEIKSSKANRQELYAQLIDLTGNGKLSSTSAKRLIVESLKSQSDYVNLEDLANQLGLIQNSDESAIRAVVQEVIKANPKAVEDVQKGEMKAIGFLVGQIMKQSKGQANPQLAQAMLKSELNI